MSVVTKICRCGKKYQAREADLKRGWAKSCSKSCAAKRRDNRPYFNMLRNSSETDYDDDPSWDAHKSY